MREIILYYFSNDLIFFAYISNSEIFNLVLYISHKSFFAYQFSYSSSPKYPLFTPEPLVQCFSIWASEYLQQNPLKAFINPSISTWRRSFRVVLLYTVLVSDVQYVEVKVIIAFLLINADKLHRKNNQKIL